jgi:hypothetical protein
MLRAFVSVGFASLGAYVDRFGSLALPLACVGLAVFAAFCAYLVLRSEAHATWPLAAADALTLLLLVPVLAVASDVLVADEFLGGGVDRFVAAALGVICGIAIIGCLAGFVGEPTSAPLALLPGVLCVAAAFVGAQRFSADAFADGMSLAWMVAAFATLVEGLVAEHLRPLVPIGIASGFLLLMVVFARGSDEIHIPDTSVLVALLASAVAAAALLLLPGLAASLGRGRDR